MNATAERLRFLCNCVDTCRADVAALHEMINGAKDITRRTFLQHVDRDDMETLEAELGYASHPSRGLTMAADWHVSYHRSHWNGRTCYYFRWSGIEYYFAH